MKLAEALQERADLNRKIEQLRARLVSFSLVQEGEVPAENPEALKKELDLALENLKTLICRINLTNSKSLIDGETITEQIARKDMLSKRIAIYKDTVASAREISYRARGSEIKILPAISVAKWQQEIDSLSRELRVLDNKIQENNWKIELI